MYEAAETQVFPKKIKRRMIRNQCGNADRWDMMQDRKENKRIAFVM